MGGLGVRGGWLVVVLVACTAASVAAATRQDDEPRAAAAEGDAAIEAPVWHPLRSGCYREVLGRSSEDWSRATPAHEGATSTSSLRFWSHREFGAEVLVIDSGGSPRLSPDGAPFVVVASGALDRTCVERMPLDACPEAEAVRRALLEHRVRLGDGVAEDGRMTVTDLAASVGLSKTPCQVRLKRLQESGVIRGFRAIVDPAKLGMDHVAFTEVKLSDTRESALREFNAAVRRIPEVEECHMLASNFDYLLKVRTSDIRRYRMVLGEKISALPHVASTSTFVAMETVLESGSKRPRR